MLEGAAICLARASAGRRSQARLPRIATNRDARFDEPRERCTGQIGRSNAPRSERVRPGLGTTAFVLAPVRAGLSPGDQAQLRDAAVLAATEQAVARTANRRALPLPRRGTHETETAACRRAKPSGRKSTSQTGSTIARFRVVAEAVGLAIRLSHRPNAERTHVITSRRSSGLRRITWR